LDFNFQQVTLEIVKINSSTNSLLFPDSIPAGPAYFSSYTHSNRWQVSQASLPPSTSQSIYTPAFEWFNPTPQGSPNPDIPAYC
jgi:hypothetical protein